MGQRHQVFIHVPNPAYDIRKKTFLKGYSKEFGEKETTVLAYHNQWLWGLSATYNCHKILTFSDVKSPTYNINPFLANGMLDFETPNTIVNFVTMLMTIQSNPLWRRWGRDTGIERFIYLNADEPEMREDFTCGDNNDGITIVDAINKKYCFMNIHEQDIDYGRIHTAPSLIPLSAKEYFNAYYPENLEGVLKENSEEKAESILKENIKWGKRITKDFAKFKLLTLDEVKVMFPKVYE